MDKQTSRAGLARALSRARTLAQGLSRSRLRKPLFSFLCGFALAFASMGSSISPFALSYVAMCAGDSAFAALGAFSGYVLARGTGGLTYAAAVLICLTCHIVFHGTRAAKVPYLMPLCAFLSLMCVKLPAALTNGLLGFVVLVCECVLCAGFCLLFQSAAGRQSPSLRSAAVWGHLAVALAALLILMPIRILGDVAPARVLAVMCVMTVSAFGGSALGAGAGVALGACLDVAGGAGPFFAAAYGFSGLLAGAGGERGRFTCAVSYVLANCVATMWNYEHVSAIAGLFECFIASVLFVMLPDSLFDRLSLPQMVSERAPKRPNAQRSFAAGRLQAVSSAVGELGAALEGFKSRFMPESGDITKVYDRAAEKICRRCPTAGVCWSKDYMTTHNALTDVTAKLRASNALCEEDFPPHFAGRCVHLRSFVGAVNEEYRAYLRRLISAKREHDTRALMSRQYAGLRDILSGVAGNAGDFPEYYPALETRVRAIARAYCKAGRVSVYSRAGRMHVELNLPPDEQISDPDALVQSLSLALRRSFWPPEILPGQRGNLIKISQRERLRVSVSCAVRKKQSESVCGDSNAHLHTDDGRAVILLSDGMGTGGAANDASRKAVELITSFVASGCGLAESTRAVLPVLAARFEHAGFVTLDLLEINMFSGQAGLVKLGAVPSFALRGGQIERLGEQSLPAGLSSASELPEPCEIKLDAGDRIVMLSDGVWENADTEGVLRSVMGEGPEQISSALIRSAVDAGAVDDMSVIVVTVSSGLQPSAQ